MRKIFFFIGAVMSCTLLKAQEPADALRYGWVIPGGTARQQAIGGAMASLGGDITAAYVNPAGLGFYKTGDVVITPGYNLLSNRSTYFGTTEKKKKNSFSFGSSGVVFGQGEKDGSGAALAIAINRTAAFGDNLLYRGINNQSSYSHKFLEEISNNNDKDANNVASGYPFGTSLAFNTYWIDTIAGGTSGNYQFQTRAPYATGLIQENEVKTHGGITELALALAANKKDKWLFGFTLGIPLVEYDRTSTFSEADATTNANNKFDYATITEKLETAGAGVNLKLGVIYKPKEYVRLGLAIHTPTFFSLTDRYSTTIETNTESYKGAMIQSSGDLTGADAEFKYWMFSPYRIMISGSYVFREVENVKRQKGFITADLEYVNYKAASFTTDPEGDDSESTRSYLKSLNRAIDNAYKGAFNFKIGGELKFTTIMARLGAAYYGNPYKYFKGESLLAMNQQKGHKFQLSGGLGYRNKGIFVDATYVHTMGKNVHYAYRLESRAYSGATIKSTGGNIVLTVGCKI